MRSEGLRAAARRCLLLLRERIQPSEEGFHLFLAGGIGVVGGLVTLLFDTAIRGVQLLFLGRAGDPVVLAESLGPAARVLVPTVGGLVAGLVLRWGLVRAREREANILEAVVA